MRELFATFLICLAIVLVLCVIQARKSRKPIGGSVALLLCAFIPPIIGNAIIIASGHKTLSTVGCYIYFLGMDLLMYGFIRFTINYCSIDWPSLAVKILVYLLLIIDVIQYAFNPIFGQAFETEGLIVDGFPYFRVVPQIGQFYHRVVCYGIFIVVIIIFTVLSIKSPKIYRERYSVMMISMIICGLWQTVYIFSRTPIDRSMIGFAVFGILAYYFSIIYRPMRLLDRMLAGIASELPEALYFFDMEGRCIWVNDKGKKLIDITDKELDKTINRLTNLLGELDMETDEWGMHKVLGSGEDVRYYSLEKRSVSMDDEEVVGTFISIRDNTEEQKSLRQELFNANHDELTGLYTREFLYKSVERKLKQNPDVPYIVGYVDVKNFKVVNDIFGNSFGDYAIQKIGELVDSLVPKGELTGRLAGDTFGFAMPKTAFDQEATMDKLSEFVVKQGKIEHRIMIHIGIYEVTEKGLDVSVMFDRAHLALSMAGDEFQSGIVYYDDRMRDRVLWEQMISTQLSKAIADKQIIPYLQPQVDASGHTVGAEALVRWNHPEHGVLSPSKFIPIIEKNGMIIEVDRYMWRSACEIISKWEKEGIDLFISVNISPRDFYFMDVKDEIVSLVKEFGIDPKKLRLEITETVMMTNEDSRLKILNDLRNEGFIVEMDDFGSGYSSLNLLKDIPVDVLKIDMVFLGKTVDNEKAIKIVQNIIHMSKDLGIVSLIEGVETKEHFDILLEMGCMLYQGYYFAKPLPLEEFEAFAKQN